MASRKVILVTGASNGIGYETAKEFLQSTTKPYHTLLGSRSLEKGRLAIETLHKECPEATNPVEVVQVDVISDESIEKAFEQVKASPRRVDALINNAGATYDIEFVAGKAYDVNVTGAQVMTWTFMPLLLKSADPRLIFVASLSRITEAAVKYSPTPPQPAGWPKKIGFETIGYRCSKTALNMLMLDWNHKLKEDGVKIWGVDPGYLATDLGGMREKIEEMGGGHPSIGAELLKSVIEGRGMLMWGRWLARTALCHFE